jgi:integrase
MKSIPGPWIIAGRVVHEFVAASLVDRIPKFPGRLKEGEPRQGFIEDAGYAALAAHAKAPWLRAFIECCYTFGFRKSELLNIRVRLVDLLERWIHLSDENTKNDRPRKVKMTTKVFELMRACVHGKAPAAYVFTRSTGERVVDPREGWYALCVAAGLGEYVFAKRRDLGEICRA